MYIWSIKNRTAMRTQKTQITDFTFRMCGYGHYEVTYISPRTRKEWTIRTTDMELVDATKNADYPKRKDLEALKSLCKARKNLFIWG